jgi:glutamine synthetase
VNALGEHVAACFSEAKKKEFAAFNSSVTPWEIAQYLSKY